MSTSNILKASLVLVFLLVIATFVVPYFVNINKFVSLMKEEIEHKTGYKVAIGGEPHIEVSGKVKLHLPNFELIYNNAGSSESFIQTDDLVISLSWHSFLFGTKNFDLIEINNSSIVINFLDNFRFISSFGKHFNVDSFVLTNTNFFRSDNLNIPIYSNANFKIKVSSSDASEIKGNFTNDGMVFNLDTTLEDSSTSERLINLNISNQDINLNLQATRNDDLTKGELKIENNNPSILAHYLSSVFPFLEEFKSQKINEPIIFKGEFQLQNSIVNISNININSDYVVGTGNISFSLMQNMNLNVDLDFEKLDMKSLTAKSEIANNIYTQKNILTDQESATPTNYSFLNFDILDNDLTLNFKAKSINLSHLLLENININFIKQNNQITNGLINFDIVGNGNNSNFNVSNLSLKSIDGIQLILGTFSNSGNNINDTLDLFSLKDKISIQEESLNYTINSQIIIAPTEISLFGINGSVGNNQGTFTGSIATRVDSLNNYNIDLKFDHIALDNFNLPIFSARLQDLLVGSNSDDYLSKFIWFRTLSSVYTIKFGFTNTQYKNSPIDNFSVLCALSPANMQLRGLVKSNFADTGFSVNLTAVAIKPTIDIKLYGKNIDFDASEGLLASLFPVLNNTAVSNSANDSLWSSQPFNLFKITRYNASLEIVLDSLTFKNHLARNFQLSTQTSNDILYIDKFGFTLFDGYFQGSGNISFYDKMLYQFSFGAANVESKKIFAELAPSITAISGPFSMSASIAAEGNSPSDLISSLGFSSNFIAPAITISGIDCDSVVDVVLQRKPVAKTDMLSTINTYLTSGSTDITGLSGTFKGSKGTIQSSDIVFKSRFNSFVSGFSLDFNNLSLASNTKASFLTYGSTIPLSYNIILSGDTNSLKRDDDTKNLISFVKATYNIVTEEDIVAEKKAKKDAAKKAVQQSQIADPNDAKYLYYKLQMEETNGQ